tara:strand:+ start:22180 stop:23112 length:933 start_codon:yes stop_codon:yes gene_type:complete
MGSGAVGSYFGSVLHKAGHDVLFIARGEHLEAINKNGLVVESTTAGNFTIYPKITETLDVEYKADLILYCVKGYQNDRALDLISTAVSSSTYILTLQNGIGSGDLLAEKFGQKKVLLGVTYIDAMRPKPGYALETSNNKCNIIFGQIHASGNDDAKVEKIKDALDVDGIEVELTSDVLKYIWQKFIYICGWSGMMSVTRSPMSAIMAVPAARQMTINAMNEALEIARAKDISIDNDFMNETIEYFSHVGDDAVSSMLLDILNGNPIEIDVINEAAVVMGDSEGISTPVNSFISNILRVYHSKVIREQNGK